MNLRIRTTNKNPGKAQ